MFWAIRYVGQVNKPKEDAMNKIITFKYFKYFASALETIL